MSFFSRIGRIFKASALESPYQTTGSGYRSRAWRPGVFGPNAALDYSADQLRNQSRDQVRKNALASSAVERIVSNTVGTGIKPQTKDKAVSDLWLAWTDESDAGGTLDFYGQQAQVMRSVVESGECFIRMRTRFPQDGLTVPLQLEIVESEFVPMDKNEGASGNRGEIRQGIEFDRNIRSRRVAYWMYRTHPGEMSNGIGGSGEVFRVPAEEVLHVFLPGRPGQIRGEPWMARVLDRLKDLEDYDKAELVRKKVAAMFAGFIRRPTPEDMTLEDLKEIWGDAENAEPGENVGAVALEPGTMQMLLPGEDVEFASPSDVGGQYEVFMRSQHRAIAAGLGVLYEQLTGDYSQLNDRTWRAAVTEFRRRCEGWQHHLMVFQFCRPVWKRWADLASLNGSPVDPSMPVKWTPQAWPYINPVQDQQAHQANVRAGFTSRAAVVSERGEDVETIDLEIAEDNARAERLGLILSSNAAKTSNTGVSNAKPEGMVFPDAPTSTDTEE
jgi:lambda family phage portal protein